jgi:two-component system response regulator PilR (NtrC family)
LPELRGTPAPAGTADDTQPLPAEVPPLADVPPPTDVPAPADVPASSGGVAATAAGGAPATAAAMPAASTGLDADGVPESLPAYLDQVEREAILRALACTANNRTAAARRLGVTFRALRHRMQRLGLS